jgi:hypothetical protein
LGGHGSRFDQIPAQENATEQAHGENPGFHHFLLYEKMIA